MSQVVFTLLLLVGGCGVSGDNQSPQPTPAQQAIPPDIRITLERTGCFGTCPSYKLTVSADGSVVFEGKEYVRRKGKVESKISQEQLKQLIAEFEKSNYFSLQDSYGSAQGGCPTEWTDNPSATTSIRINGKSKSIFHYYGCREQGSDSAPLGEVYPRELTRLETRIDEIVGTQEWIGK